MIHDSGLTVGIRVQRAEVRLQTLEFTIHASRSSAHGSRLRAHGSRFRRSDLGPSRSRQEQRCNASRASRSQIAPTTS
eukprot:977415-Rhodomonas_salina.5